MPRLFSVPCCPRGSIHYRGKVCRKPNLRGDRPAFRVTQHHGRAGMQDRTLNGKIGSVGHLPQEVGNARQNGHKRDESPPRSLSG